MNFPFPYFPWVTVLNKKTKMEILKSHANNISCAKISSILMLTSPLRFKGDPTIKRHRKTLLVIYNHMHGLRVTSDVMGQIIARK